MTGRPAKGRRPPRAAAGLNLRPRPGRIPGCTRSSGRTRSTPDRVARARAALAEFREFHAAQPGYAGSIEIEIAPGERIVVNLWQAERDAQAGMAVLVPHVQRLLEPLMAGPSQFLGTGKVATTDLAPQR